MRKSNLIILFIIILIALVIFGCRANSVVVPTKTPSPEDEALRSLNAWGEDMHECPADYPDVIFVSGELNAMVDMYKQDLYDLGLRPRWNCKKKLYEIVPEGESSSPICGCQSKGITSFVSTLFAPPSQTSSPNEKVINDLNNWYPELLNMVECRADYGNDPHTSGHQTTISHIELNKKQASELGLQVRWNCHLGYEIVPDGEDTSAVCGCVISVYRPTPIPPLK